MSRRIASLIGADEREITRSIKELEAKNGYPSHDVRHMAENIQNVRQKITDLGLDPDDTSAQELYHALLARFERDSREFELSLGLTESEFDQKATKAAELVSKNFELHSLWSLNAKSAKAALRAYPPKKVTKYLNYRSLESMLKRENISDIMLGAQLLESKSWHKNLAKYISGLDPTDFEMHPVKLAVMDEDKWSEAEPESLTVADQITGTIAIVPVPGAERLSLLAMMLILIEELSPTAQLNPGKKLADVSSTLRWWSDMDQLLAECEPGHVSLNIKDCSINHLLRNDFSDRITENGTKNFWRGLVGRYNNRPSAELFEAEVIEKVKQLGLHAPEPAYEFAEEFDG